MQLFDEMTRQREAVIERYEQRCALAEQSDLAEFLLSYPQVEPELLEELLCVDVEWRLRREEFVREEDYETIVAAREEVEALRQAVVDAISSWEGEAAIDTQIEEEMEAKGERLGRFELLEVIGEGSFATVHRARDTSLDRLVAIKIPHGGRLLSRQERERFSREGRHAARLNHPGIVPVYEVGSDYGRAYIVSEYVEGKTLANYKEDHEITPAGAAQLVMHVAEALDHAHQCGIVHRDLKPANILLEATPRDSAEESGYRPRVTDFGLARLVGVEGSLTLEGQMIGTPAYMSPEQAAGDVGDADPRSDLFSLGVIFYELLTGSRPFVGPLEQLLVRITREDPVPPRTIAPRLPRDLETICLTCLQKSPERRYESAAALVEDLRRWARGEAIRARRASLMERLRSYRRRYPRRSAAMAVGALVAVLCIAGLIMHNLRLQQEVARADYFAGEAKMNADSARHQQYVAHMNLAAGALQDGLGRRAYELLSPFANSAAGGYRPGWEWGYCWRRCHQELRVTPTERGAAQVLACSHDGALMVVAGESGQVRLIDAPTGRIRQVYQTDLPHIWAIAISKDDERVWLGDNAGGLSICNVSTGEVIQTIQAHDERVSSVAISPSGGVATCSPDGTIKIWKFDSGEPQQIIHAGFEPFIQIAYLAKEDHLVSLTAAGVVNVWDSRSGNQLAAFGARGNDVLCFAVDPSDKQLACGGYDGALRVWNLETGELASQFPAHPRAVRHIQFRSDGSMLASAGDDLAIRTWRIGEEEPAATLTGRTASINAIEWIPHSPLIASADEEGSVSVWAGDDRSGAPEFAGEANVFDLWFTQEGDQLGAAFEDGLCRLRDVRHDLPATGKYFYTGDGITTMAFDAAHGRVATGNNTGAVILWDWESTRQINVFDSRHGQVTKLAFSPAGDLLATVGLDGVARVWEVDTGVELATLGGGKLLAQPYKPVQAVLQNVAFSPDGRLLAAVGNQGALFVWRVDSLSMVFTLQDHQSGVESVAFSRDVQYVATGSELGSIHVRSLPEGQLQFQLGDPVGAVHDVVFSADGDRLACGSSDGALRVWEMPTGELLATLSVSESPVTAVAFSGDGTTLACGDGAGLVHCFSAAAPTHEEVAEKEIACLARFFTESYGKDLSSIPPDAACNSSSPHLTAQACECVLHPKLPRDTFGTSAEGPWRLNAKSWSVVWSPGRSREQYAEALVWAEQAYLAAPDEPWVLVTYGTALYRVGRFVEAERVLRAAEAELNGELVVSFRLAMCRRQLGKTEQALDDFESLHQIIMSEDRGPSPISHFLEADRLIRGADVAEGTPWELTIYRWDHVDANSLSENRSEIFSSPPLKTMQSENLHFKWGRGAPEGAPDDYFAIVATSEPELPAGAWELQLICEGEVRVYLDGKLLLDSRKGGLEILRAVVDSPGRRHQVRVEYLATIGLASLETHWRPAAVNSVTTTLTDQTPNRQKNSIQNNAISPIESEAVSGTAVPSDPVAAPN